MVIRYLSRENESMTRQPGLPSQVVLLHLEPAGQCFQLLMSSLQDLMISDVHISLV